MATVTMGSPANNTFTALPFAAMAGAAAAVDIATIAQLIKNDLVNGNPTYPDAFSQKGILYIPNRGVLKILPGDYVAIDTAGWPILVSARSAATGASWTHT